MASKRPCKYTAGSCRFPHLRCRACPLMEKLPAKLIKAKRKFRMNPRPYIKLNFDSSGDIDGAEVGIKGDF